MPPSIFMPPEGLERSNPTCRGQVGRWVGAQRHLYFIPQQAG